VVYALEVTALRPAMRAQITARWQDVYDYYENCLHGGKLLLATDIGTTVQDLVHSEALSVAVDDFLPPDQKDDTYRRAVDQMQTYVLEQFFKPTLAQSPPPPDSGTDGLATIGNAIKDIAGFFSITYALRQINRSELKTLSYQLNVASAERLTLAPQGTFPVLLASTGDGAPIDASKLITEVTPAASEQMDFDVGAAIDLDGEEIDHLEVFIRYGERSETLLLDGTTPRRSVTFWYQQEQGLAIHYRYEVHFKLGAGNTQDVLKSADASTEDRIVRIDPRALYQRTGVRTVAEGIPFARFPTVIVDLKVDDPAGDWSTNQTLQLDAAHTEASWTLRSALEARIMFQRRLRYVDAQGTETAVDWDYAEPGILIVGNPYPEVLDVQIVGSARFDTEVRRLIVELRLKSQADKVVTKVLTKDQPFATWSVPLENCEKRAYEYRVTIHTVGNEAHEGQWLSGADGTLVVGERIARLRQVQMVFVGRSLKDLQLLGVKVRFVFDDADAGLHAENEMLVQDASKPLNWSYPVADQARQSFIYQLSLIHADGRIEQKDPVTTADLLVVCPMT